MAFFQTISEDKFQADADFVVKESKKMRRIIGSFFLLISLFMLKDVLWMGLLTASIGIGAIIASMRDETIMKINRDGFFYYGRLLTNWTNFVSAEFIDEMPVQSSSSAGLSDQFFLYIKYFKDDSPGCFALKIPLTNTQDKAEEEILAAVRFYYRKSTVID
ncbi:hypothetical protein [Flavisolibacter nicotianae]|uniref:hypothetical protein n=1 Tax=Flavisolibacter nicotianae TaxID=2364882 RepID=UPI000EAC2242|nr:hypothetical protein [Flavisolibacter nicotianae]